MVSTPPLARSIQACRSVSGEAANDQSNECASRGRAKEARFACEFSEFQPRELYSAQAREETGGK